MGALDNFIKYLRDVASKKGIPSFIFSWLLFILSIQLGVIVHEFGHMAVANLVGCRAFIGEAEFYTGWTGFDCPDDWPQERLNSAIQIIALSGPLTAFFVGCYLWFLEEDGLTRVMAIPFWLYSCLPNLYIIPGSDMSLALQYGLNPLIGISIYFGAVGLIGFAIVREVIEREWV